MANNSLSFPVTAPDEASASFAKIGEALDKLALKIDELGQKDVTAKVKVGLDDSSVEETDAKAKAAADAAGGTAKVKLKLDDASVADTEAKAQATGQDSGKGFLSGLSGISPLMGSVIAGALTIGAPVIAGAAVLLGVGAMAAVGLGLQKNNPLIQQSLTGLESQFKTTGQDASSVLVQPLAQGLNQLSGYLQQMEPEFKQAFAAVGPAIQPMVSGLEQLVSGALPGFVSMLQKAGPIVKGIEDLFSAVGTVAGQLFQTISDHSGQMGSELSLVAQDVKLFGSSVSSVLSILSNLNQLLGPVLTATLGGISEILGGVSSGIDTFARSVQGVFSTDNTFQNYINSLSSFTDQVNKIGAASTTATTDLSALAGVIDKAKQSSDPFQSTVNSLEIMGTDLSHIKDLAGEAALSANPLQALVDGLNGVDIGMGNMLKAIPQGTKLPPVFMDASRAASALGLSVSQAGGMMGTLTSNSANAGESAQQLSEKLVQSALAINQSESAISTHFQQADQAVTQSQQSVSSASYSLVQAQQSVAAAEHSAEQATQQVTQAQQSYQQALYGVDQAQRQVAQAQQGVLNARYSLAQADQTELTAQKALNQAYADAVQNLKDLQLQESDAAASALSNRVSLFDAQQAAASLGVTPGNAQSIADETITASNEAQVKAAIALIQAQNAVNDGQNNLAKSQTALNTAQQEGVQNAPNVVSAQQALASAVHGVESAQQALVQSEQSVQDSEHSLVQAHQAVAQAAQGVANAEYAAQQAHQQVANAIHGVDQAAQALSAAQQQLKKDQDNASRSLDLSTTAGQQNMQMLLQLYDTLSQHEPKQQAYNDLIQQTADKFGLTTQNAEALLKQLGLIQPDYKFDITGTAKLNWGDLNTKISPQAWASSQVSQGLGNLFGVGHADGGHIVGPGGPTDDRIPAMLSDGEFVVNASATARNLSLLQRINANKFADGGQIIADNLMGEAVGARYAMVSTMYNLLNPGALGPIPADPFSAAVGTPGGGGQISYNGPTGVAQWSNVILQALSMLGQPASWLGTVERRMNQESGGNPTVVNKWDSNWAKGTPSVGLMQVIGPTFAAYANQLRGTGPFEYGVSVDPLANTFAGLNYALHRYGSLAALNQAGGYAGGGRVVNNGGSTTNHYHLNVHNAANNNTDIRTQFNRMAILNGV